jgi:hypothetical protein
MSEFENAIATQVLSSLRSDVSHLTNWAREHGVQLNGAELRFAEHGVGGFATEDIEAGTVVFKLPQKLALSAADARNSATGQLLLQLNAETAPRVLVYFYMIEGRYIRENFHSPYLRSLSDSYSDPLHWNDPVALELLQGTNLGASLSSYTAQLRSEFEQASALLFEHDQRYHSALYPSAVFTWSNYLWARSAFCSRCYPASLLSESRRGGDVAVLLPILDSLNHVFAGKVTWISAEITGDAVLFRVDEHVQRGSAIPNNYGAKINEELLLCYGFVMRDNPCDAFPLKLALSQLPAEKRELFIQRNWNNAFFVSKNNALPSSLIAALMVMILRKQSDIDAVLAALQSLDENRSSELKSVSPRAYRDALKTLDSLLKYKLEQLRIEQHEELSHEAELALQYRIGQRQVIEFVLAQTRENTKRKTMK